MDAIKIYSPNDQPFGPISNHAVHFMTIDDQRWKTVTNYILANFLTFPTHRSSIQMAPIRGLKKNTNIQEKLTQVIGNAELYKGRQLSEDERQQIRNMVQAEVEVQKLDIYDMFYGYLRDEMRSTYRDSLSRVYDQIIRSNPALINLLIGSTNSPIIYISSDTYLGIDPKTNEGYNLVGQALMQIRQVLIVENNTAQQKERLDKMRNTIYTAYKAYIILQQIKQDSDFLDYKDKTAEEIVAAYIEQTGDADLSKLGFGRNIRDFVVQMYERGYLPMIKKELDNPGSMANEIIKNIILERSGNFYLRLPAIIFDEYLNDLIEKKYPNLKDPKTIRMAKAQLLNYSTALDKNIRDLWVKYRSRLFPADKLRETWLKDENKTIELIKKYFGEEVGARVNRLPQLKKDTIIQRIQENLEPQFVKEWLIDAEAINGLIENHIRAYKQTQGRITRLYYQNKLPSKLSQRIKQRIDEFVQLYGSDEEVESQFLTEQDESEPSAESTQSQTESDDENPIKEILADDKDVKAKKQRLIKLLEHATGQSKRYLKRLPMEQLEREAKKYNSAIVLENVFALDRPTLINELEKFGQARDKLEAMSIEQLRKKLSDFQTLEEVDGEERPRLPRKNGVWAIFTKKKIDSAKKGAKRIVGTIDSKFKPGKEMVVKELKKYNRDNNEKIKYRDVFVQWISAMDSDEAKAKLIEEIHKIDSTIPANLNWSGDLLRSVLENLRDKLAQQEEDELPSNQIIKIYPRPGKDSDENWQELSPYTKRSVVIDGLSYPSPIMYVIVRLTAANVVDADQPIKNTQSAPKKGIAISAARSLFVEVDRPAYLQAAERRYKEWDRKPGKPARPDVMAMPAVGPYENWSISPEKAMDRFEELTEKSTKWLMRILARRAIFAKFQDVDLQNLLLLTGQSYLIWADGGNRYLGGSATPYPIFVRSLEQQQDDMKDYQNVVGQIWMDMRKQLQDMRQTNPWELVRVNRLLGMVENDPFIRNWVKMRVADMCNIVYWFKDYLWRTVQYNKNLDGRMVEKVLDNIYQPCQQLVSLAQRFMEQDENSKLLSEYIQSKNPQSEDFILLIQNCSGLERRKGKVKAEKEGKKKHHRKYNPRFWETDDELDQKIDNMITAIQAEETRLQPDQKNRGDPTLTDQRAAIGQADRDFEAKQRQDWEDFMTDLIKQELPAEENQAKMKEKQDQQRQEYMQYYGLIGAAPHDPKKEQEKAEKLRQLRTNMAELLKKKEGLEDEYTQQTVEIAEIFWTRLMAQLYMLYQIGQHDKNSMHTIGQMTVKWPDEQYIRRTLLNTQLNMVKKIDIDNLQNQLADESVCSVLPNNLDDQASNCILSALTNILTGLQNVKTDLKLFVPPGTADIDLAATILLGREISEVEKVSLDDLEAALGNGQPEEEEQLVFVNDAADHQGDEGDDDQLVTFQFGQNSDTDLIQAALREIYPDQSAETTRLLAEYTVSMIAAIKVFKMPEHVKSNRINFFATIK